MAVGLLADLALGWGAAVLAALGRRIGRRRVALSRRAGAEMTMGRRQVRLAWAELLPLVGGLALAALWLHPLLSAWSVLLGLAGAWVQRRTASQHTAAHRATQELFLNALRSRYAVAHSLTQALSGAAEDLHAPAAPLVVAATATVRHLRAGVPLAQALAPVAALDTTVMRRLATILARSDLAAEAETQALLEELEDQARLARRLADRAQVTLAATRTTLRVLVVAAVVLAALCAALPLWRAYYLARPGAYSAATGLTLCGYAYFAFKIKQLEASL